MDHHWIFPAADVVVTAGDPVAASLPPLRAVRTIPNAIDLDRVVRQSATHDGPPVIGTVAMLRREKGLLLLVDATATLRDRLPGVRVRIAGEGPLRHALEQRIRARSVEDVVELCGYVTDIEVFYRSLHIYVQPSDNEPFGIAALEAFRFGIPLVMTNGGFLPTLLGNGAWGLLVDHGPDTPDLLAGALETAWRDREIWSEKAGEGLEHWSARLSRASMVRDYRQVFAELLDAGRPGKADLQA